MFDKLCFLLFSDLEYNDITRNYIQFDPTFTFLNLMANNIVATFDISSGSDFCNISAAANAHNGQTGTVKTNSHFQYVQIKLPDTITSASPVVRGKFYFSGGSGGPVFIIPAKYEFYHLKDEGANSNPATTGFPTFNYTVYNTVQYSGSVFSVTVAGAGRIADTFTISPGGFNYSNEFLADNNNGYFAFWIVGDGATNSNFIQQEGANPWVISVTEGSSPVVYLTFEELNLIDSVYKGRSFDFPILIDKPEKFTSEELISVITPSISYSQINEISKVSSFNLKTITTINSSTKNVVSVSVPNTTGKHNFNLEILDSTVPILSTKYDYSFDLTLLGNDGLSDEENEALLTTIPNSISNNNTLINQTNLEARKAQDVSNNSIQWIAKETIYVTNGLHSDLDFNYNIFPNRVVGKDVYSSTGAVYGFLNVYSEPNSSHREIQLDIPVSQWIAGNGFSVTPEISL